MSHPESSRSSRARQRNIRKLNALLDDRLLSYAATAAAAGVSVLALGSPAGAEVVFTPTHQQVSGGGVLHLDLNNDGITDFDILVAGGLPAVKGKKVPGGYYAGFSVGVSAFNDNRFVLSQSGWAAPLSRGQEIGKGDVFQSGFGFMLTGFVYRGNTGTFCGSGGPWKGASQKFLGFEFSVDGETHYGWARFTLSGTCTGETQLSGYAYETIANRKIHAGQTSGADETSQNENSLPATLGRLAQGAYGWQLWENKEAKEPSR